MSNTKNMREQQVEQWWQQVEPLGLSRRRFLALLASSGIAAVIAACAPSAAPTTAPTAVPAQPTLALTSAATAAAKPILKPLPADAFIPLGTNAEMRFEVMANKSYAMPNANFFVRNHTATPSIDVKTWKLSVEGDGVAKPFELTYDELLKLPSKTVTRFVECAGNGRSFYDTLLKKPAQGGQWKLGAYGIAEWTGVPLAALLERAGMKKSAVDVMPVGLDSQKIERPMSAAKAMEEDTLLAYQMNGEPLPPDHGFPARVVTPGWVGLASIKWVGKIVVSEKPIFTDKNTNSYVFIGPDYQAQPPAKGPILTTQVMKSALALPWPAPLKAGAQKIVGYAWSPFGKIAKVEVSMDEGKTWQAATLVGTNVERAGTRWEFSFDAKPGDFSITPRASDDKGNTQLDLAQQKWNEQGYLFGASVPHPVKVT